MITRTTLCSMMAAIVLAVITSSAHAAGVGQLGILDTSGINPATGVEWAVGDQYRLIFVSSVSVDPQNAAADAMAYWNDAVQAIADNATTSDLSGATWRIVGSTADVDARDNTLTNPTVQGAGHPIMNMDGSTVMANDFNDLWNQSGPQTVVLFDENAVAKDDSTAVNWPLTGTFWDGTADGTAYLKDTSTSGNIRQGRNIELAAWIYANGVGANWYADSALSVYGMSDPLTVVPEPATFVTGLLGVALIGLRRRRA